MKTRRPKLTVTAAAAALLLTACGTPPWEQDPDAVVESLSTGFPGIAAPGNHVPDEQPADTASDDAAEPERPQNPAGAGESDTGPATPTSSAASTGGSAAAVGTIVSRPNDLGSGATKRSLTAGALELTVDYWSPLAMDAWEPGVTKPISISLTGADPEGKDVYLSRMTVATTVTDADGVLIAAPAAYEDRTSVSPGYLMSDPYSYATTVVLPAVDAAATDMVVSISYELLVQSTPLSDEYVKQTAVDTLRISLTGPVPAQPAVPGIGQVSADG